jgi:hypothetical protein
MTACTFTGFGTVCVDLKSNDYACGACPTGTGVPPGCGTGKICDGGACVTATTCSGGKRLCPSAPGTGLTGEGCVDTNTDSSNCGACGNQCANNEVCAAGTCSAYAPGLGCTTCPCTNCADRFGPGASCCPAYGTEKEVICVDGPDCP